jgi:hypothetical protein
MLISSNSFLQYGAKLPFNKLTLFLVHCVKRNLVTSLQYTAFTETTSIFHYCQLIAKRSVVICSKFFTYRMSHEMSAKTEVLSTGLILSEDFWITVDRNLNPYVVTFCSSTASLSVLREWTQPCSVYTSTIHPLTGGSCCFFEGMFCSQTFSYKYCSNPGVLLCVRTDYLVCCSRVSN